MQMLRRMPKRWLTRQLPQLPQLLPRRKLRNGKNRPHAAQMPLLQRTTRWTVSFEVLLRAEALRATVRAMGLGALITSTRDRLRLLTTIPAYRHDLQIGTSAAADLATSNTTLMTRTLTTTPLGAMTRAGCGMGSEPTLRRAPASKRAEPQPNRNGSQRV